MRLQVLTAAAASLAAAVLACGSNPDPPPDRPPAIERVLVSPEEAAPGDVVHLAVVANDPEGGALGFEWELPPGWFIESSPFGASIVVRAPPLAGEGAVATVTVTDPGGRIARDVALLRTAPPPGVPPVTFRALLAQPNPVAPGGTLAVAPLAESADGAAVEYTFQLSEPGWSLEPAGAVARVVAPLAFERAATLTVSARGAAGGRGVARVVLSTEPRVAPHVDELVASPRVVTPGATVALRTLGSSPHGLPLQYAWSIAGEGWTLAEDGASATATAPRRAGASATVAVVVTDLAGGTASGVATLATADATPSGASLVATPQTLAPGGVARLVASAPPGAVAPLAYAWSVDDPGWTLSARGEVATLSAPLAYARAAVVTVEVTGAAADASAAHEIVTTQSYTPPAITSLVVSPAAAAPGGTLRVAAVAASPAGLPLSRRWTVAGEGWTIAGDGPDAVVTAPPAPGGSAIVALEVADAAGASARAAIAVATAP